MIWLRSLVFNVALFSLTAFMCFLMIWALLLPREKMIWVVHLWLRQIVWLERNIAGISMRVIGQENIPQGASLIVAKHQSAWETFKLHLLFGDPAIVLKKELLYIPIWGWYLLRSGMIPIDRSVGTQALSVMMKAAYKARDAGRKIVIFPQGTRVPVGMDRPYKMGYFLLYRELNLPIVPMALNSGLLWGKNAFIKKPGVITVEFLPPIAPGLPREKVMDAVRTQLEAASNRLATEAT